MRTISIIVPALNEKTVIYKVLNEIYTIVESSFDAFEIIAIDDGSTDDTGEIMDRFCSERTFATVIHNSTNIGLGNCFKLGLAQARFRYVMLLCGDGGLPAASLPKIFKEVGNYDLIIPYMKNLKKIKTFPRFIISKTYVLLMNLLFGYKLIYYNGLPVYRTVLAKSINITSSGFGFQAEIIVKMLKSGCNYIQVEVYGAEETGRSHAFKLKNVFSVANTFLQLILAIFNTKPIPPEIIEESRINY